MTFRRSTWEDSWPLLINKRAAIKEQFPPFSKVANERPGTTEDRARREFYHADNRVAVKRAVHSQREREMRDESDADAFIACMKAKKRAAFLERIVHRQEERKSA